MGRYFEDFQVDEHFVTQGRTIGEGDIHQFAGLVGDYTPLHVDAHYASKTRFGSRTAHGPLGLGAAIGLFTQLNVLGESVVGLLNLNWDFKAAVKLGDTIHARVVVIETRLTSKGDTGIVKFQFEVLNQREELTQRGVMTVMIACRDARVQ